MGRDTVVALMSSGITDSSLKFHLENAKKAGVTKKEIAAVVTHVAFYAGWPKGWAVFNMAKEVWSEDISIEDEKAAHENSMVFPAAVKEKHVWSTGNQKF